MALLIAPVIIVVLNYSLVSLAEIFYLAILPVYLASTPLSLTPRAIGVFMGGMGIFNGVFQLLCTAPLVERWGAKRVYQVGICAYFPLFALFPIAVGIATTDGVDSHPWRLWLLALVGVMLQAVMDMSFSKHSNRQMLCPTVYWLINSL